MLKIYMLIIVLGLVGGVVYGGWYYYKDTQERIQILTENSAKLEHANDYKNNLIAKLRKHDLTRLSQQKPGLVEKKINNGTKKLFKSFESITARPTDK